MWFTNLEKNKLKAYGIITTVILSFLFFICLFVVGYDFKEAHQNWTSNGGWRHMGVVQVATVVVALVVIAFAILTFTSCSESKIVLLIFVIINGISMLFTLSIALFALIAGAVGRFDHYIGCNSGYKRIIQYWRSLDHYFIEVDKMFCSKDCPCYMSDEARQSFKNDPMAFNMYEKWDTTNTNNNTINYIEACDGADKEYVMRTFHTLETNNYRNGITDFDQKKFSLYWGSIEERFKCTGWCGIAYQSTPNPEEIKTIVEPSQMMLYKYLFSNVNRGVIRYRGCLSQILWWLPRAILAYGALTFLASIAQVICFLFALALLLKKRDEENANDSSEEKESYKPANKVVCTTTKGMDDQEDQRFRVSVSASNLQ